MRGVIIILAILSMASKGLSSMAEKRLMEHLFNKSTYDNSVRPVYNNSHSLNVTLNLAMYQLIAIDEKDQLMKVSAWLSTKWSDYQMQWNPDEYNGIREFRVRSDKIWVPDIVLYNNVDDSNSEYGGNMDTLLTRIKVFSDGKVSWNTPLIIKASCKILVREFPYDVQVCYLMFGSWTYDISGINLLTTGIDTSKYMQHNAWNLNYSYAYVNYTKFSSGTYPDVKFYLHYQRKSLFYAANLIFPMSLITMLTILTFILPSESGERIGLGVTLMLTATVFMLLVAETVPESSEGLPLVSIYVVFCMVVMFLIIVSLCFISRMYNRGRTDSPMSQWTRRWILNRLSYSVGIRHYNISQENNAKSAVSNNNTMSKPFSNDGFTNDDKDVYFINRYAMNENENPGSILRRLSRSSSMDSGDIKRLEFAIQRLEDLGDKKGGRRCDDSKEHEEFSFEEEWRIVAMTVDRVFFIFFSIVFTAGTIGFYAPTNYVK